MTPFEWMKWALEQQPDAPGCDRMSLKLVLVALASFADGQGRCFPSQAMLARASGLRRQTVNRILAALEEAGYFTRTFRGRRARGGRTSDLFQLQATAVRMSAGVTFEPPAEPIECHFDARSNVRRTDTEESKSEESKKKGCSRTPSARARPPKVSKSRVSEVEPAQFTEMMAAWNALAQDVGLVPVEYLTDRRRKLLRARLADVGIDGWHHALSLIRQSKFLTGGGKRGWLITFDWLLEESNCAKVMENTYAENQLGPRRSGGTSADVIELIDIITARRKQQDESGA